jgi:hypothetical protein
MAKLTNTFDVGDELVELSGGTFNNVLIQVIDATPVIIFVAEDDEDIDSGDVGHTLRHVSVPSMSLGAFTESSAKVYARSGMHGKTAHVVVTEY